MRIEDAALISRMYANRAALAAHLANFLRRWSHEVLAAQEAVEMSREAYDALARLRLLALFHLPVDICAGSGPQPPTPRATVISLGTVLRYAGRWWTVSMVGITGGERYYWLTGNNEVVMIPAFMIETSVIETIRYGAGRFWIDI